ncbi:MAG: hypothetical protein IJ156_00230 [Bacteroidales bacterium]|nr:hypothetical protein [Bacteroidales bacterium]
MDNCLNSDHLICIRAKRAAEEVNRLRGWKRTEDRFEENKAHIKKDCLAVLSGLSTFSWEKMHPENRYGQITEGERARFMLSVEGTGKMLMDIRTNLSF